MQQRTRATLGRWFVWMLGLWLGYVVLADHPTLDETVTGLIIASIAALAAVWLHHVADMKYAARWEYVRHLAGVPKTVVTDTWTVGCAIIRSIFMPDLLKGHVEEHPFEVGDRHDPSEAVRRALVAYGICLGPNTIVCGQHDETLFLHRLILPPEPPQLDPRWPL